jgi:hypothetical protein
LAPQLLDDTPNNGESKSDTFVGLRLCGLHLLELSEDTLQLHFLDTASSVGNNNLNDHLILLSKAFRLSVCATFHLDGALGRVFN